MNQKNWKEVLLDIESAVTLLTFAVTGFNAMSDKAPRTRTESYLFQHAMQAGYTSIESAIKKIFQLAGEEIPAGDSFHKALVRQSCEPYGDRPAIFDRASMYDDLDELRSFRHVAMRSYDNFRLSRAALPAQAADRVAARIKADVIEFIRLFDPDAMLEDECQPRTRLKGPGDKRC